MVVCDQEMICHGGQEGPAAEGAELAGNRNVRNRMDPCMGLGKSLCIKATLLYAYNVIGYSDKGKDGAVFLEKFLCVQLD